MRYESVRITDDTEKEELMNERFAEKVEVVDSKSPSAETIIEAAGILRRGGVVIFPTDTVYGLGVLVSDNRTPEPLFTIKGRDREKCIPWLVACPAALDTYGRDVPDYARKLVATFWPGPLTLVVKSSDVVPRVFGSGDDTVALRMPDNAVARALIIEAESPVATSSANRQGEPAPCAVEELDNRLLEAATLILDGGIAPHCGASTVVSCLGEEPVIIRKGVLSKEDILKALS